MTTRDETIQLARQAGFRTGKLDYAHGVGSMPFVEPVTSGDVLPQLEQFATLLQTKDREVIRQLGEALTEMMEYAGIIEERCDSIATNKARAALLAAKPYME